MFNFAGSIGNSSKQNAWKRHRVLWAYASDYLQRVTYTFRVCSWCSAKLFSFQQIRMAKLGLLIWNTVIGLTSFKGNKGSLVFISLYYSTLSRSAHVTQITGVGKQEVNKLGRVIPPGARSHNSVGVNWSGFECHGGNPQSNKTKWGCIDALSCFIWWLEINEL